MTIFFTVVCYAGFFLGGLFYGYAYGFNKCERIWKETDPLNW